MEVFDDFTVASSWERFISDIETVIRSWMFDGPRKLLEKGVESIPYSTHICKVKGELKYGSKVYCMEYYFPTSHQSGKKSMGWSDDLHDIQLMFGVKEFLVLAPTSASGVVLDAPEASKLLSSIAIALSNCGSAWPAFVPVHDPTREAFFGIQNMGTNFTRRFDADCIRSQVPLRLMRLEGLYQLFLSKFGLYSTDFSSSSFKVKFSMKLTYITPDDDLDLMQNEDSPSNGNASRLANINTLWDDDYPWSDWYSAEDPIKGFKLTAIWSQHTVGDSLEMEETENATVLDAEEWLLSPVLKINMTDDSMGQMIGFSSQLIRLIKAFDVSLDAKFIDDLTTGGNPASLPAPSVLDRVLKELFHDGNKVKYQGTTGAINGAPLESLFAQFCLNALWFGNCDIHSIAALWIEFVREVRWYWEESQPLPRTMTSGRIDLSACLVHQKIQMLAICIDKKGVKSAVAADANDSNVEKIQHKPLQVEKNKDTPKKSARVRKGSSGIVGNMMLLNSPQKMHAPHTQDPPIMTEDMHEERLQAVEALGDDLDFSAQLEKETLSSDMSAFKAANPDAVFEDFIRWHSPGDWETVENKDIDSSGKGGTVNADWPPHGRLSARMSEHGNSWRQLWNESPSLPVSEQKPLIDPVREGEKVLHYLETLRPRLLLEQMIFTAFKASLDILSQTPYGNLTQMRSKIEQLYKTISTSLKILRGNNVVDRNELIGDLVRLCTVFEHVEKLLMFAGSVCHKFSGARRLCEAIFDDFYSYYLPKMGTGSSSICYDKVFKCKQPVKVKEREAILRLFPQPSASQSWRKVLSMGNLLNGHEPLTREIIFSAHDQSGRNLVPKNSSEELETHRMYVHGTSNDLQVALAVASWD